MLQSASQSESGFMIYSAMLSMGSCIGYLLSAVDWQTFSQTSFCSSEQTAILIVLFLFSITLLVTMITAQERPYKRLILTKNNRNLAGFDETEPILLEDVLCESAENELLANQKEFFDQKTSSVSYLTIKRMCLNSFRLSFIVACIVKVIVLIYYSRDN